MVSSSSERARNTSERSPPEVEELNVRGLSLAEKSRGKFRLKRSVRKSTKVLTSKNVSQDRSESSSSRENSSDRIESESGVSVSGTSVSPGPSKPVSPGKPGNKLWTAWYRDSYFISHHQSWYQPWLQQLLPEGYVAKIPRSEDRACSRKFTLCVYSEMFKAGFRFPLTGFVLSLLAHYGVAPGQLVPNAWSMVTGFQVASQRAFGFVDLNLFRLLFVIRKTIADEGWFFFVRRSGMKMAFEIVKGNPSSIHTWKSRFFFVFTREQYPVSFFWRDPDLQAVNSPPDYEIGEEDLKNLRGKVVSREEFKDEVRMNQWGVSGSTTPVIFDPETYRRIMSSSGSKPVSRSVVKFSPKDYRQQKTKSTADVSSGSPTTSQSGSPSAKGPVATPSRPSRPPVPPRPSRLSVRDKGKGVAEKSPAVGREPPKSGSKRSGISLEERDAVEATPRSSPSQKRLKKDIGSEKSSVIFEPSWELCTDDSIINSSVKANEFMGHIRTPAD